MTEEKKYFGKKCRLIERIESLDQKWFVEVWNIKYYFIGIEIFSRKKESVRRFEEAPSNLIH
jgi:hypothetical protein